MKASILLGLVLLLAVGVSSAVRAEEGAQPKEPQAKQGVVKSVDVEKKTIVVALEPKDLTFTVTDKTTIAEGKKALTFSGIKVGAKVKVEYAKTGEDHIATKITIVPAEVKP